MNNSIKKKKNMKINGIISLIVLVVLLFPIAFAIPTPMGIDGTIYDLDGITPVWKDTKFSVTNINTGQSVEATAGRGSIGRYSASIGANSGDLLLVRAWNKYNTANFTTIANGIIHNAHFVLNMTYPPLAPIILTSSVPRATEKVPYTLTIEALDDNDDALSYWLVEGPQGMSVQYDTATIQWTPGDEHTGNHSFTISVYDGIHFTNRTFSIEVEAINDAPIFTSTPPTLATVGQEYVYEFSAFDAEGDSLTFILQQGPAHASIGPSSGILQWKPSGNQKGEHLFSIQVSDGQFSTLQSFTVTVSTPDSPQGKGSGAGSTGSGTSSANRHIPMPGSITQITNKNETSTALLNTSLLLSDNQLEEILLRLKIQDVIVMPNSQSSLVNILAQRPQHIAPLQSKVYRYLQIENPRQSEEPTHLISFRLEKEWLNESRIGKENIVLKRYVDGQWTHLATSSVSEDERFAYYLAQTPGFSYFAITVREGVSPSYGFEPQSSSFKQPYTIIGAAYSFARLWQVTKNTPIILENLNSQQKLEIVSGAGPYTGAYVGTITGTKGDLVKVSIGTSEALITLGDESIIPLDFVKRLFGKGYVAVPKNSLLSSILSPFFSLFLMLSVVLLAIVIIQRSKEKTAKENNEHEYGEKSKAQEINPTNNPKITKRKL